MSTESRVEAQARALTRAVELLSVDETWVSEHIAVDSRGVPVSFHSAEAARFCAHGALHRASWEAAELPFCTYGVPDGEEPCEGGARYVVLVDELMKLADQEAWDVYGMDVASTGIIHGRFEAHRAAAIALLRLTGWC